MQYNMSGQLRNNFTCRWCGARFIDCFHFQYHERIHNRQLTNNAGRTPNYFQNRHYIPTHTGNTFSQDRNYSYQNNVDRYSPLSFTSKQSLLETPRPPLLFRRPALLPTPRFNPQTRHHSKPPLLPTPFLQSESSFSPKSPDHLNPHLLQKNMHQFSDPTSKLPYGSSFSPPFPKSFPITSDQHATPQSFSTTSMRPTPSSTVVSDHHEDFEIQHDQTDVQKEGSGTVNSLMDGEEDIIDNAEESINFDEESIEKDVITSPDSEIPHQNEICSKGDKCKLLKCYFCGKFFKKKSYIQKHIIWHMKKEEYTCQYCKLVFLNLIQFSKHVSNCVEGDRRFKCPKHEKMYKIFASRSLRKKKEFKYVCDICGQKCLTKEVLKSHFIWVHVTNMHCCDICKESFKRKSLLVAHELKHEGLWKEMYIV